jgi:hypothetical protein
LSYNINSTVEAALSKQGEVMIGGRNMRKKGRAVSDSAFVLRELNAVYYIDK